MPDHIQILADQLLPSFIPKDKTPTTLVFQFTMVPNITYRVSYNKTVIKGKDVWTFEGSEEVDPQG